MVDMPRKARHINHQNLFDTALVDSLINDQDGY